MLNRFELRSFRPASRKTGWTNQELAEFYRVTETLRRQDIPVVGSSGITDEGDPWFVFERDDGEGAILLHLAKIDGEYHVVGGELVGALKGRDFRSLIEQVLARMGMTKVHHLGVINTSVGLAAAVAALFYASHDAHARDTAWARPQGQSHFLDPMIAVAASVVVLVTLDAFTHEAHAEEPQQAAADAHQEQPLPDTPDALPEVAAAEETQDVVDLEVATEHHDTVDIEPDIQVEEVLMPEPEVEIELAMLQAPETDSLYFKENITLPEETTPTETKADIPASAPAPMAPAVEPAAPTYVLEDRFVFDQFIVPDEDVEEVTTLLSDQIDRDDIEAEEVEISFGSALEAGNVVLDLVDDDVEIIYKTEFQFSDGSVLTVLTETLPDTADFDWLMVA